MASQPVWLKKYLRMSPEVTKIYNDLDAWLNYCRFRMIKFDEADLYKSVEYREWQERRKKRQQWQQRNGVDYKGRRNA
jgi:hypothetical protein